MQTSFYFRSPILSFFDLSETQKESVSKDMDYLSSEDLENESFVFDSERNEILPLSNFMRMDKPGIFCGVYGITAFSAYFIALSCCGTEAVVTYKHC